MKWFRRERKPDPGGPMQTLRAQALALDAAAIGAARSASHPRVWGLLMETGYPTGVATLACFVDGTTSLYYSSGGGVIGGGQHARVRQAAERFLGEAERFVGQLAPTTETPLPAAGRVRFYARTFDGTLGAEADEDDLGNHRLALSPLFHAGHAVLATLRELTTK